MTVVDRRRVVVVFVDVQTNNYDVGLLHKLTYFKIDILEAVHLSFYIWDRRENGASVNQSFET